MDTFPEIAVAIIGGPMLSNITHVLNEDVLKELKTNTTFLNKHKQRIRFPNAHRKHSKMLVIYAPLIAFVCIKNHGRHQLQCLYAHNHKCERCTGSV